jgi:hypothetical protein
VRGMTLAYYMRGKHTASKYSERKKGTISDKQEA